MSHEDKRRSLEKLDRKLRSDAPEPRTLWDLIRSIHSLPALREWVTLESTALCPCATALPLPDGKPSGEAIIYVLLSCPGGRDAGDGLLPPWGCVAWHWPSRRSLMMLDVQGHFPDCGPSLDRQLRCTESFATEVQRAIETNSPPPPPPDPLPGLYRSIAGCLKLKAAGSPMPESKQQTDKSMATDAPERRRTSGAPIPVPPHPATPEGAVPLPELMTRARSLISESGQEQLRPEWRRIYGRMNRPAFSVVVAGEFSRGKSVLVNKLLGRDVLPVGNLPTTAMLTRITHGPEPVLWRIHVDGRRERLPLTPESWDGLVVSDDGIDPEGVLHVELPNDWLQSTGIEIYDAPGAGDLTGRRAEISTEAIASCDATLLTVSATMALSLTERAFMEEHVLARKIPRIAVVLTHLDEIDASGRNSVIGYARDKLKEWAPQVKLWSSQGDDFVPAGAVVDTAGPEAIRGALADWASDEEQFRLRALQIASQLRDLVGMLRDGLALRLDALRATAEEREESLRLVRQALDRRGLEWEDLRLEFERREQETASWLEGEAMKAKDEIAEALTFQLSRAPNRKEWCEKDFPYLVRRELLGRSRSLNAGLGQRIDHDAGWLRAEVGRRFEWPLALRRPERPVDSTKGEPGAVAREVEDIVRIRWISRATFGALTVASYMVLPVPGIGMAVSILGGLITELLLSKTRDNQRRELASAVEQAVHRTLRSFVSAAQDRLRSTYRRILDETRRQAAIWAETRRKALVVGDSEAADIESEKLEKRSREANDLIAALAPWTEGGDQ